MSAGSFITRVYQSNLGSFHNIKSQPETAIFSIDGSPNVIPAGPVDSPFWVKASRGAKEYGMKPRMLKIRFDAGEAPTGYRAEGTLSVVVYRPGEWQDAVIGSPCTYLGGAGTIIGKIAESVYPAPTI